MDYLCKSINSMFKSSMLPDSFKLADVTPIHKKGRRKLKEDYRSVSILLLILSKLFERMTFTQISAFLDNVFSKCQCGFWKGYSNQPCNLKMLEKWKKCAGKGNVFGALLIDLSKA